MSNTEHLSILNSADEISKVKLLQKLIKTKVAIENPEMIEVIKELCHHNDIAVRFWAKKVASNFAEEDINKFQDFDSKEENLPIDMLFKKLNSSPSHFVAIEIIQKVFERKSKSSFEELVSYLKSCSDEIIISFLVKNLCKYFPEESTLTVVIPYLKHKDDRVVANCVEGVGFIPSPKATLVINQMLSHENHRVRANAAKALSSREPETTKKVIKLMLQAKEKPHFIIAGCYAIGELKLEEFLPELSKIVLNPILSEAAVNAILRIGGEISLGYLEPFSDCEDKEISLRVKKAIGKIKSSKRLDSIGKNVSDALNKGKEKLSEFGKSFTEKLKSANEEMKNKADKALEANEKADSPPKVTRVAEKKKKQQTIDSSKSSEPLNKPMKYSLNEVGEYIVSNSSENCSLPCFFLIMGCSFVSVLFFGIFGRIVFSGSIELIAFSLLLGTVVGSGIGNYLGGYCRSFLKFCIALSPTFLLIFLLSFLFWHSIFYSIMVIIAAIWTSFNLFFSIVYCENCNRKFLDEEELATLEQASIHKLLATLDKKTYPMDNPEVLEADKDWPHEERQKRIQIFAKSCPICLDSILNVYWEHYCKEEEHEKVFGVDLVNKDSFKRSLIYSKLWKGADMKKAFGLKRKTDY